MSDLLEFLKSLSIQLSVASWSVFLITWSLGWILRGAPVPFARLKRIGQDLIEDAVWAAFWLSVGSVLFTIITRIAAIFQAAFP